MLDVRVKKQMKPEYDCTIRKLIIVKSPSNRTLSDEAVVVMAAAVKAEEVNESKTMELLRHVRPDEGVRLA
jgi:hypothetical protein